MARTTEARRILLVEDDPDDILLLKTAFRSRSASVCLEIAEDGERALAYLGGEGAFAKTERPDLVLLDLRLPKIDGWRVLLELRRAPRTKGLPVIVFTTSASREDVERAYEMGANAYVQKPRGLDRLADLARLIDEFWFRCASLPG